MYQDLSFMKVPLPEDVLKLKIYGDYAGAQKMIRYFLEEKDIPQALRKRLEIEQEVIGVMVEMNIHLHMMKHWRSWLVICVISKKKS